LNFSEKHEKPQEIDPGLPALRTSNRRQATVLNDNSQNDQPIFQINSNSGGEGDSLGMGKSSGFRIPSLFNQRRTVLHPISPEGLKLSKVGSKMSANNSALMVDPE